MSEVWFSIAVVFDPQSWYSDPELELGVCDLSPGFFRGYRSVVREPRDLQQRHLVYDLMLALLYCRSGRQPEFEKHRARVVELSKDIRELRAS